jgi:hypothetical protein
MTDDLTRPIETPPAEPAIPAAPVVPEGAAAAPAPTTAPAATAAVTPVMTGGSSRGRWIIGLGAVALAIAVTIGAVLAFGQPAAATALQYVPGDSAVVVEIRLDLPGDQMQNLGSALAHFPGFADPSTLSTKLDEALDKFVAMASDGKASYVTDLKPWINGPLFIAATADALSAASSATSAPQGGLISATTNGAVTCAAAFKDQTVSHETYQNLDLVLSADKSMACAVDGRQAVIGDTATVRKALDAKAAGTGMHKNANYTAARAALGGDRLTTVYMDGAAFAKLMPASEQVLPSGFGDLLGAIPDWLMFGARAESDAFVLDFVAAPVAPSAAGPSLLAVPPAHASVLTEMVPGDTVAFVELQGAGVGLQNMLTQLRTVPELASSLEMLDGLGSTSELLGWIEDVGVAVSVHGTTVDGAVLLVATDEMAATTRVASLNALLTLAGSGDGMEVTKSTIAGTAVTTVTITDVGSLIPPGSAPGIGSIPATGPISFSLAAHGKVVLVTTGEAAMTAFLNTTASTSLAENAAFKHATARGLQNAQTTMYLGVGATVELVKGFLPADELAKYQSDVAPYVDPFEAVLAQGSTSADGSRSRFVVTVRQP